MSTGTSVASGEVGLEACPLGRFDDWWVGLVGGSERAWFGEWAWLVVMTGGGSEIALDLTSSSTGLGDFLESTKNNVSPTVYSTMYMYICIRKCNKNGEFSPSTLILLLHSVMQ